MAVSHRFKRARCDPDKPTSLNSFTAESVAGSLAMSIIGAPVRADLFPTGVDREEFTALAA